MPVKLSTLSIYVLYRNEDLKLTLYVNEISISI